MKVLGTLSIGEFFALLGIEEDDYLRFLWSDFHALAEFCGARVSVWGNVEVSK